MAYPENIDSFTNKLNKLDNNTYVIEEIAVLKDGVYEGELQHDNISLTSLNVYTGSKLTGTKVKNVILSTPSAAPWKKIIKIFSQISPVYITYETTGDTVEADDINKVQDSLVNIENEVERYKSNNDTRVTTVENNKAEKTYVDTELNKRYLKAETYTKEETDQRIQMVVNAAPSALDTLKELADALNDDPNFAATITTQLSKKVDKVNGKQLSTEDYSTVEKNKLAGVENNANNYIHPTTHPAAMITTDSTHEFVTDENITNWNGKANASEVYSKTDADTRFATKHEIQNAGAGDMLKYVYDKDGNGVVDNSSTLEGHAASYFAKLSDIPKSLPANGGTANKATITHRLYRHDNENEDVYYIAPWWTNDSRGWRIGAYNTSSDEQSNIHKVSVDYSDTVGGFSASGTPSTNEKSNIIGMVNEVFQNANSSLTQLNSNKDSLYNAIVGKGTTPASKNFSDLIDAIKNISTGKRYVEVSVTTDYEGRFIYNRLSFTPSTVIVRDPEESSNQKALIFSSKCLTDSINSGGIGAAFEQSEVDRIFFGSNTSSNGFMYWRQGGIFFYVTGYPQCLSSNKTYICYIYE